MNHHHFNDDHPEHFLQKVAYLDNNQRQIAISPTELLAMIPLKKTDTILDVGAGTGFMTLAAAEVSGTVYALDLSHKMLELISVRAKEAHLTNIELLNSSIEELPLADESVNHVLASLVLHELPSLEKALQHIYRVLHAGGHLICLELEKNSHDHHGQPRLTAQQLTTALEATGFKLTKESHPTDSLYVLIARK